MIPLNENSLVTRLVRFWFNTAPQRCRQLGQHEQACDRGDDHYFKRHPAIIIQTRQAISLAITRPRKNKPQRSDNERHVASFKENCAPKHLHHRLASQPATDQQGREHRIEQAGLNFDEKTVFCQQGNPGKDS